MVEAGGSSSNAETWVDFIESRAADMAKQLSKEWHDYSTTLHITHVEQHEVLNLFTPIFATTFTEEMNNYAIKKQQEEESNNNVESLVVADQNGIHVASSDSESIRSLSSDGEPVAVSGRRPKNTKPKFLRRFSSLKEVKNVFFPPKSDALHGNSRRSIVSSQQELVNCTNSSQNSANNQKCERKWRVKRDKSLSKTVVEIVKEGVVHYMCGNDLDAKVFDKCRMCLIKTAGGFMIEFYSPPKSSKPRNGIFCMLISEAREATRMEVPDKQYCFVLKADGLMEYVIDGRDAGTRREWLDAIRLSMTSYNSHTQHHDENRPHNSETRPRLPSAPPSDHFAVRHESHTLPLRGAHNGNVHTGLSHSTVSLGRITVHTVHNNNTLTQDNTAVSTISNQFGGQHRETNAYDVLVEYPWFHPHLSRHSAAQLVLQAGTDGNGLWLVRHSETRQHEYVLTFNCMNRAKHVRLTVVGDGECRVQNLWFSSVFSMIDHFRNHHIPLDNNQDATAVMLADYLIAWPPQPAGSGSVGAIDARDYATHSGSVRIRTQSLERLAYAHANINNQQPTWAMRCENAYHFT